MCVSESSFRLVKTSNNITTNKYIHIMISCTINVLKFIKSDDKIYVGISLYDKKSTSYYKINISRLNVGT